MNRARVLMTMIALGAAGAAGLVAKNAVRPPEKMTIVKEIAEEEVLVAARDIGLGEVLTHRHLRWQPWPKKMARGYISRKRNPGAKGRYVGTVARVSLQRGEPISARKVVSKGRGGVMAAILPSGMRAVSTPIKADTAAGGFILPNDRVDVILSRTVRRGRDKMVFSDTILKNVRVLAIGEMIEAKNKKKSSVSGRSGSTATLELTAGQARTLAAAQEQGEIVLALRSLADLRRDGQRPEDGKFSEVSGKGREEDTGEAVKYLKYGVPTQAMGL